MSRKAVKAQAGLEYLMTYGWALVLIAAVLGVLVFIVSSPGTVVFSSSDPTKILMKGGTIFGTNAEVKLQNITGGRIEIIEATMTGNFSASNCTLNDESMPSGPGDPSIGVGAGGEIFIECDNVTESGSGIISIKYTDYASLTRSFEITAGGETQPAPEVLFIGSCDDSLNVEGTTYVLANDISVPTGDCLTIGADNITLDCDGKSITGSNSPLSNGVYLDNKQSATIENCTVTEFRNGIHIDNGSTNVTVTNNTLSDNGSFDIYIHSSSGNTVSGNTTLAGSGGIYAYNSANNTITGNTANEGIELGESSGNTISNNTITATNYYGIYFYESNNNTVSGNTVTGSNEGMYIEDSYENSITGNTVTGNSEEGIYFSDADDSDVTDNTVENNAGGGIWLNAGSSNNNVSNNTVQNNGSGISFTKFIWVSINNTVNNNTACGHGPDNDFYCDAESSTGNIGTGNKGDNVSGCEAGLEYSPCVP